MLNRFPLIRLNVTLVLILYSRDPINTGLPFIPVPCYILFNVYTYFLTYYLQLLPHMYLTLDLYT